MSSKVKRKVTVESSKEDDDQPRRQSVFERLGPNAGNVTTQSTDRHRRPEAIEKCRDFIRGVCEFGSSCRFKHEAQPASGSSSSRRTKSEKEAEGKDLRHKVKTKREDTKEIRPTSTSPKRKESKRNSSRSRKSDHDSKIKSTVVVTRPKSPSTAQNTEVTEHKKKPEGNWEDDSDDWLMDAAQLDYKEELTLERKRQQLQRELELELQKEQLMNEGVTITKTVSFTESSSSSSSSDSGSLSSSSNTSASSSEEDSSESSSSSSSSSSTSPARLAQKKRQKKASSSAKVDAPRKAKPKDNYDRIKSSRSAKTKKARSPSPSEVTVGRKGREKRRMSPPSSKKRQGGKGTSRSTSSIKRKGPRTPSPVPGRKQRQWTQSSSAESRGVDKHRSRNKRHKKKKVLSKNEKYKTGQGLFPPRLSSPNRTALLPVGPPKKGKSRDEFEKPRHRRRGTTPLLLPRSIAANVAPPPKLMGSSRYQDEKIVEKSRSEDRSKTHSRRELDDLPLVPKRPDSRDRSGKRVRSPPRSQSTRKLSLSPHRDRFEVEHPASRKLVEKLSRHKASPSPIRVDRRKNEMEKKREREPSPRETDRREQYRVGDSRHEKKGTEQKVKRIVSPPEVKKLRDDRSRDHPKDRNLDYDTVLWPGDVRKPSSLGRHTPEVRSRQELLRSQQPPRDRSRDRDQDRKKRKERDLVARSVVDDVDRVRLSPRRSQSPLPSHLAIREIEPLTSNRSRLYESDLPPPDREYPYTFDALTYLPDRLLPSEYEAEVLRVPPGYPSDVFPESHYRRGAKDSLDRYSPRDLSPRDVMPHRDIISLTGRPEDYITELSVEESAFDERWARGGRGGREEWDPYTTIAPTALPPHVAAALDEDRYGMPRRRRAEPEWPRGREDRDSAGPPLSHRPAGRGREGRSRTPPSKGQSSSSRSTWSDRERRHDSRNTDNRNDSRNPDSRNTDTRNADSRNTDSRNTDSRNADSRNADSRNADSRNADSRNADSRNADSRNADSRNADSRNADSRNVDSRNADSRNADSRNADSRNADSRIADSRNADSRNADSRNTDSRNTDSRNTDSRNNDSRNNDSRPAEESQKVSDDRKSSNIRNVRKERMKRKEDPPAEEKISSNKEKSSSKRPHSPSPQPAKTNKKKKTIDVHGSDLLRYHGGGGDAPTKGAPPSKSSKDEAKTESKSTPSSRTSKTAKQETQSSKAVETPAKEGSVQSTNETKTKDREEKKSRKNDVSSRNEDGFSDWSDDDDDLLTRVDFVETQTTDDAPKNKRKEDRNDDKGSTSSRRKDKSSVKETVPDLRKDKDKENRNRTSSKDRVTTDPPHGKEKSASTAKEVVSKESVTLKEDTVTDVDEYITAESVDYDPISDDELDALIEEPDDSLIKPVVEDEKSKIVDALDVNWSALMSAPKTEFTPGFARRHFKAAHVLSRIGFSQALAGPELSGKIIASCQKQLDEEGRNVEDDPKQTCKEKKFAMEHHLAAFHVSISKNKRERFNLFQKVGPYRRALCARRDLQIRKILCKPINKLATVSSVMYTPQYSVVDKDLYKQSLELLKLKKQAQSQPVGVC